MIYYPLKRLKNCLSIPLTYGLNEPAVEDNPEWPRYIRITDFDDNDCLRDETFKSLHPKIAEAGILKKGDILLARSGATVGKAFHFNDDIKLSVDDLVVVDGHLYSVENPETIIKQQPKPFNIYFATLNNIL